MILVVAFIIVLLLDARPSEAFNQKVLPHTRWLFQACQDKLPFCRPGCNKYSYIRRRSSILRSTKGFTV